MVPDRTRNPSPVPSSSPRRRIERQIRETLGDRVRDVEVRITGRNAVIVAQPSRFWLRRSVRRSLEALPALEGYRARIEIRGLKPADSPSGSHGQTGGFGNPTISREHPAGDRRLSGTRRDGNGQRGPGVAIRPDWDQPRERDGDESRAYLQNPGCQDATQPAGRPASLRPLYTQRC